MSDQDYTQDLLGLLERLRPHSVLGIGATAGDLLARYARRHADVHAATLAPLPGRAALACDQAVDCALVTETLERLPRREAGILLSRLRDLYARYLLVVVRMGGDWSEPDLLAYGLRRLGRYRGPVHVYAFDIYDYKITPDWLNSKYWAHPELFDKYWW